MVARSRSSQGPEDGKAMRYYEVALFALCLTPATVITAAQFLSTDPDVQAQVRS